MSITVQDRKRKAAKLKCSNLSKFGYAEEMKCADWPET